VTHGLTAGLIGNADSINLIEWEEPELQPRGAFLSTTLYSNSLTAPPCCGPAAFVLAAR
jgi:hypothetical protein